MGYLKQINGLKTYIAAAIAALTGLLQILNGDFAGGWALIVQAAMAAGLRNGVAKVQP